jgi:hypothetical protein
VSRLTALFATFAGVFLVVGGNATLQAAQLTMTSGVANAFGGKGTGAGFAIGFGTEFFGHDDGLLQVGKTLDYPFFKSH